MTPDRKAAFLASYQRLANKDVACEQSGISRAIVRIWKKDDAQFAGDYSAIKAEVRERRKAETKGRSVPKVKIFVRDVPLTQENAQRMALRESTLLRATGRYTDAELGVLFEEVTP